jgi:hypothetical protein
MTNGAARMESQTPGVQWPTVTRPADNTDALLLLSAPRMCVCGHPVYDDQEPRCSLCGCQEHKPRLPPPVITALLPPSRPAPARPGDREGQPELPGRPVLPCAAARRCPEAVPANAPRQRHPGKSLDAYRGALEAREAELRAAEARLSGLGRAGSARGDRGPAVGLPGDCGADRAHARRRGRRLAPVPQRAGVHGVRRAGPQRVLQRSAHQARLDHQGRRPEGVRTALMESAQAYRYRPAVGAGLRGRQAGADPGTRPVLEGAAAAAPDLEEDDRPRQAARRHGHRRGPRARRVRLGRDDQLTSVRPARRPAACRETTPRQEMTPV